ncbi:hypothetical protein CN601_07565 [Bacillus sp. AFS017336]|nr:hypothetical protein CN601_07565 [Bacillus sp. AFS017336]
MHGDAFYSLFALIPLIIYVAPIVFIIWFLLKFLKLQQEKNQILKSISDKLDNFTNNHSES